MTQTKLVSLLKYISLNYKQMKTSRQLSRLTITGHVYEHTPMCVLMEIADSHGIKYEQKDYEKPNFAHHLLASIHQTPVPSISTGDIKEMAQWQFVARFVNKHSQWLQGKLTIAYNFLVEFMNNEDPLIKIPHDFVIGLQTPDNPYAINACILYKTCIHYRLNVNSRTTINQMAYAVRMLRENVESVIRRAEAFVKRDAKRLDLINVLMLSPYEIQDPDPMIIETPINHEIIPKVDTTHDLLVRVHESLVNIRTLQQKIDPTTDAGAVALAAINYNIDISRSADPTREYKILRISGRNDYRPADPWMNYWYQRNPIIFDLTVTFNPLFPVQFYDVNLMISLVQNEGYTTEEMANIEPYELLQLAYVSDSFVQGEMPNLKSRMTPIDLDNVDEVPYGQLLCYGQFDAPWRPITINELTELFNANQNFSTPFGANIVFSPTAISKLKIIAQSPSGPNPNIRLSQEAVNARANLLEAINGVELLFRNNDEPSRQLALTYRNADPDTKHAIRNSLTYLLNAGMAMRGWLGSGEYPVLKAPVPPGREHEVAINVTDSLAKYEASCRSLGRIGTLINNLPLVTYKDGEYQASVSPSDGLTIGQRISIVKEGEQTGNIASCIRLSSNWLCSSAHKYIMALGFPSPFDIFHLRHIS